jgi:hypothetical protein
MEKILLAGRSGKSPMTFDAFASLLLSKVPGKTRAYWERWLCRWRSVLVEKWSLSDSPNATATGAAETTKDDVG